MRASVPIRALAALALAATIGAGCGGDDDSTGGSRDQAVTVTTSAGGGPAQIAIGAYDVYWDYNRITAPAGDLVITMTEEGVQNHTFVFEDIDDFKLSVDTSTKEASGSISLEPGEYVFYCDVPGHRGQGMEGTLTLE